MRIVKCALVMLAGWAMFAIAAALPWLLKKAGMEEVFAQYPWLAHCIVKTVLALLAAIAIFAGGLGFSECGFRRARDGRWWLPALLFGGMFGAVATVVMLAGGGKGLGIGKELGLGGIVLWVWIYSSTSEEIFTRGWFQSALKPLEGIHVRIWRVSFSAPVLLSAFFFSTLHLSLLFRGVDFPTLAVVLVSTFVLGLLAGRLRESQGSLLPAVAAHISFNVGGTVAGVICAIATKIATGHLPGH